jgi:hypothetical protein
MVRVKRNLSTTPIKPVKMIPERNAINKSIYVGMETLIMLKYFNCISVVLANEKVITKSTSSTIIIV